MFANVSVHVGFFLFWTCSHVSGLTRELIASSLTAKLTIAQCLNSLDGTAFSV